MTAPASLSNGAKGRSAVGVTFLGASTLLIDDGQSRLLIDGYFSRSGLLRLALRPATPDCRRIRAVLDDAGISALDAIFVAHSHVDHALDAASVAALTHARRIYGSGSTGHIVAGQGYDMVRFERLADGNSIHVGRFVVTALAAAHSPSKWFPGTITRNIPPNPRVWDFRAGRCYSFHITHEDAGATTILVHPSAGYRPDELSDHRAQFIYLGVGALGRQDSDFREQYWKHTVCAVNAHTVIPIHWDRFTRPLSRPLKPFRWPLDRFGRTKSFLSERCTNEHRRLEMPRPWERRRLEVLSQSTPGP